MKKIIFLVLLGLSFVSCLKDKTKPIVDCPEISYTYDVRPIIENSCKTQQGPFTGCHDAWIDDFSAVQARIEKGEWEADVVTNRTMPKIPNTKGIDSLTADEIHTMQCWLYQGYPEN